jgi:hypothetical protein
MAAFVMFAVRHAEESLHVVDLGGFAGLLPPDGEVADNSVQQ